MKRKPLSAAAKGFKKAKLQKIEPLKKKADRALQDWYRAKYPGTPCESCGKTFQVMHHYVPKSQSAGLRFEESNLIFLCHACHFRHHRTGDPMVMGTVIEKRGLKWMARIKTIRLARKHYQIDRPFLNAELTKYQQP